MMTRGKVLWIALFALVAVAWPRTDAHAAGWVLDGFDVTVTYTVPVPPGFTATKERVTINVPKEKVPATVAGFRTMMADIQQSFDEADPYKGWAPFTYGLSYGPRWKQEP